MASFLSKIAKQITQVIAPPPEANEDEANRIWQDILNCTLQDSKESLNRIHDLIQELLDIIKMSMEQSKSKDIIDFLSLHQIPMKLVNFSEGNVPNGFINEVVPFFIEFAFPPLSIYLNQQFIFDSINKLLSLHIRSTQNAEIQFDQAKYEILLDSLLSYVNQYPDDIAKFVISETSSPFLTEILHRKYFFEKYTEIGNFIFPLLAQTKSNQKLNDFLVNSSSLIRNTVKFIKFCIENCTVNPKRRQFLFFLDIAIQAAPAEILAAFYSKYESEIVNPLVIQKNQDIRDDVLSLKYSIYILTSFNSFHINQPIMKFFISQVSNYLSSKNDSILFLTIRCLSIIFEHSLPSFHEYEAATELKYFADFVTFLPSDWFINPDMKQNSENAGARVTNHYCLSRINPNDNNEEIFTSIHEILEKILQIFSNFLDNNFRINLALTDLFSFIASLPNHGASFFAFSQDCPNGLVKTMEEICLAAKRRIGQKEETHNKIQMSYEILAKGWTNEQEDIQNENTDVILFNNIVTLIEFCKELAATAQSRNLFHQRDEYFIS